MNNRRGLIAGRGELPFEAVREIIMRGYEPYVIGLKGEVNPELAGRVVRYVEIEPGNLQEMLNFCRDNDLTEMVFAGKVGKEAIFHGGYDELILKILKQLPEKNDDAILGAIVGEFEKNGIVIAKQTDYLRNLLVVPGMILGELSPSQWQDVKLGFRMAKASGGLDIGQSVIVKQGVVLAVEAIEGTDQAILRGGVLGGPGSVVVKVSKPKQDERFDVPTVGAATIESMIKSKANVLAVEAGTTLLVQQDRLMELATEAGIKIVGVSESSLQ